MSNEKIPNQDPEDEYGYDPAYREDNGPIMAPPFRGNPQEGFQRPGYRPRMSAPQDNYQAEPRGYSSRRYPMDDHVYPGDYGNARGYGGVRRNYPYYSYHERYHEGHQDYRHNRYHDYGDNDYHHLGYHGHGYYHRGYPGPGYYHRGYPGPGYYHHGYHHNDYCHNDHYDYHHYGPSRGRGWLDPEYLSSIMRSPTTNNFFRGVGVATIAMLLAPPIAKALKPLAVQAVHGVTSIVDELKGVVYEAREDIEDIFADGKWANMEHEGAMKQPPFDNQ